jgi:hypothetical protein
VHWPSFSKISASLPIKNSGAHLAFGDRIKHEDTLLHPVVLQLFYKGASSSRFRPLKE